MAWSGAAKGAAIGGGLAGPLGAAGGALIGSGALNSVFKPIGNVFKGIGQGIMGTNTFNPNYYKIDEQSSERDRLLGAQARQMQAGLGNRLTETMEGNGPSVARLQMQQGQAAAAQQAAQQAANARGVSRGLALRTAQYAGQQGQQAANRDAALLQAQEQLSARDQYAGLAGNMRAGDMQSRQQDIDIEKGNQGAWGQQESQRTAVSEGNANRKQKGTGAIISSLGSAVKGLSGIFSDIRAKEDIQPVSFAERLGAELGAERPGAPAPAAVSQNPYAQFSMSAVPQANQLEPQPLPTSADQIQPKTDESGGAGIAGAIGGGMEGFGNGLMSDRRSKERIRELESQLAERPARPIAGMGSRPAEIRRAMDAADSLMPKQSSRENLAPVNAYSYEYKPGIAARMAEDMAARVPPQMQEQARRFAYADARAPRVGVMAQDLEKSPAGENVVTDTPVGKMLNEKRAIGFALANQADLDKRLRAVESRKGRI